MHEPHAATRMVEIAALGERLSALRLCDAEALTAMRRSLEQHGQLAALTLFTELGGLQIIDGFKRVRAARALGWTTLLARTDDVGPVDAKLRLRELHDRRGLTELEEAWLVRSLYREDGLLQPEIARRMNRHKSWVWRRLMLVEGLDPLVQSDVRLGLIAPRAAVAVSRLPRGNQQAASAVVIRRGLTVRQTEALVDDALLQHAPGAREAMLVRRLDGPAIGRPPGPRPARAPRSDADWLSLDILRVREIAARLEARLLATPLEVFAPAAAELMRDALAGLRPRGSRRPPRLIAAPGPSMSDLDPRSGAGTDPAGSTRSPRHRCSPHRPRAEARSPRRRWPARPPTARPPRTTLSRPARHARPEFRVSRCGKFPTGNARRGACFEGCRQIPFRVRRRPAGVARESRQHKPEGGGENSHVQDATSP